MSAVAPEDFRNAMARVPTGIAVITTCDGIGSPIGMTANSFTSVSLDPPLVLWCIARRSPSFTAYRSAAHFAVNVLAANQLRTSQQFSRPCRDKFEGVPWVPGVGGVPVILGCAATFECELVSRYWAGDHEVHLGQVVRATTSDEYPSLAYYARAYAEVRGLVQ